MKYLWEKINGKSASKLGIGAARFGTLVNEETAFLLLDTFTKRGGTLMGRQWSRKKRRIFREMAN